MLFSILLSQEALARHSPLQTDNIDLQEGEMAAAPSLCTLFLMQKHASRFKSS